MDDEGSDDKDVTSDKALNARDLRIKKMRGAIAVNNVSLHAEEKEVLA